MPVLGPYYYGKYKWDNYLLDVQRAIKSGNAVQREIAGVQKETLAEMRGQTIQLQNIQDALEHGFEELRAEFEWGFSLIADRMDRQIAELTNISATLEKIHQTVRSPLMTRATELFRIGEERYRKGLLDKALEAFLQAEQQNDVDFVLQLQIGKLFLYGRDEFANVINLADAERHLLLAARYADAEKGTVKQWSKYCGQAYFHAAIAAYLLGEQEETNGDSDGKRTCLKRAVNYLSKATNLWPAFSEIWYTLAKCHALLNQSQEVHNLFETLSDRDRRYFDKAMQDEDFRTFREDIKELFTRALTSPGPCARGAQTKLASAEEALAWAKRASPASTEDQIRVHTIERRLTAARQILPTLQADVESLSSSLSEMGLQLEQIAHQSLQKNIATLGHNLASTKDKKASCASSIDYLNQKMRQTSGRGAGWLVGLLCLFIVNPFIIGAFSSMLTAQDRQRLGPAVALIDFVASLLLGLTAASISRAYKNGPHKSEIIQLRITINECDRIIVQTEEHARQWQQELSNFLAWKQKVHALKPRANSA